MPCSHMMSMNCRPPLAIDESSTARLPAAKARILKSRSSNIGSVTCSSMYAKSARTMAPPPIIPSTKGLPQPMFEVP